MFRRGQSNLVRNVLDGTEEVICHRGTHQYGERGIFGVSACGLAALNFARVIFEKARESARDEDLLRDVIAKETVQVSPYSMIDVTWSSEQPFVAPGDHRYMRRLVEVRFGITLMIYHKNQAFSPK